MDFIHLWQDDRALSKILRSTIPIPVHGLKGKAILKENINKMKDILFPNILVQVS